MKRFCKLGAFYAHKYLSPLLIPFQLLNRMLKSQNSMLKMMTGMT